MAIHKRCALLVALAPLLFARAAHADPDSGAQTQLRRAFEYCDQNDTTKYFSQRDFAFKVDPTIKTWSGSVKKYPVQESLARCDASMGKKAQSEAHEQEVTTAFTAVRDACRSISKFEADYPKAKAAFLAKNGNSPSFALSGGTNTKDVMERCEQEMGAIKANLAKNATDEAAKKAAWEAQEKAAAEHRAKEAAAEKAVWAKLKGDRLSVAKRENGLPTSPDYAKVPSAATWTYALYRGGSGASQGYLCTTVYTFKGNKQATRKSTGPGCSL